MASEVRMSAAAERLSLSWTWGTAAGADGVDDEALGFFGFGSGGGLGVAGFALHYADAIEQELGDISHGDGVFSGDAIVGDLF
jgi:hypothetical protein